MASLQEARLDCANLRKVKLNETNLRGAVLTEADLQGANLQRANSQGAVLAFANLQDTDLDGVIFDEDTVLPDSIHDHATREWTSKWTPSTDMARYTDPNHPDFWRPEPGSVWWYPAEEDTD